MKGTARVCSTATDPSYLDSRKETVLMTKYCQPHQQASSMIQHATSSPTKIKTLLISAVFDD